jgi:hypothetical protein
VEGVVTGVQTCALPISFAHIDGTQWISSYGSAIDTQFIGSFITPTETPVPITANLIIGIVFDQHSDINGVEYDWDLLGVQTNDTTALDEEVWYCYVLNLDQRQRTMSQWIYKRDVDDESKAGMLNSTILRKIYSDSRDMVPFEALVEGADCLVIASDMRATNIRLFNDVIPEDYHDKLLNQMIVGNDSRHLVFADNANMRIDLPRYPLNE